MTLIKRTNSPFSGFPSFFDDFFVRDWNETEMTSPQVNIRENDDQFTIEVAAPGMAKEDFKIELNHDVLTISTEKKESSEEKDEKGTFMRREFRYESFKRSFNLPKGTVNSDKISALYVDGILKIDLPKLDEVKPKPIRTIEIS